MAKSTILKENINSRDIDIQVHFEKRNSVRYSFGKDKLIFRIPSYFGNAEKNDSYHKGLVWAKKTIATKPHLLERLCGKKYEDKFQITVMDMEFNVSITKTNDKNYKYVLKGYDLTLMLPHKGIDAPNSIAKILSKIFAKYYKEALVKEVMKVNENYFKKNINDIRLKYNSTNWGSCSSKRNLNFSTRVLLLPYSVRRYIIIHELSHLIQMNHSSKFWQEVRLRYPEYKKAEKFLKQHGGSYDF
jgi:predicted metal-dependent hydrolase